VLKENTKGIVLFRGFEGVGGGSPVARRGSRRRCRRKTEWSRVACRARELVDVYVGVVRKNEEDVVGINADTNVVRDAEANKEWQVNVG
jgi:hypothetical protein